MRTTLIALAALGLSGCSCNQTGKRADDALTDGDPGRVTLHRLNRAEYDNTVRDLLGTTQMPAQDFPFDDSSHGFDNLAATLTVSPLHVEMYERAAESLAIEALEIPLAEPAFDRFEAEGTRITTTTGGGTADGWNLWSNGDLTAQIDTPEDGRYAIRARVYGQQAGPDLVSASLSYDGWIGDTFDIAASDIQGAEVIEIEAELVAGVHSISVSFNNDFYDPDLGEDRNMIVDWIEFEGPLDLEAGPNPIREKLLVCEPTGDTDVACARLVLESFAPKAWRRPVTGAEIDSLLQVFEAVTSDAGTWDDGMQMSLMAVLLSPNFIYRVELDPNPNTEEVGLLSDYELASRLSYFLWSSMPDDELFAAAEAGTLHEDDVLAQQVSRMIADPKAQALVDNFAGQWLYIRAIDGKSPDIWEYPDFDEDLRASMKEEMARFFQTFLDNDRDLHELLLATEGQIDARLAEHYGIDGVTGWQSVDLASYDRGGLLTQSGLLLVNSYPARTSPVLRGKWVLSNLLCSEPPPPPAGVEGLVDDDTTPQTLREQLEQHRADPVCASCHDQMDPIGLGMEHFDGIGAWRDTDAGFPVDASGVLPDGTEFYGTQDLAHIVASDARYPKCIVDKLFTYGLGRSPKYTDVDYLEQIEGQFADGGYTFEALAIAIAQSETFRMRHGEKQ